MRLSTEMKVHWFLQAMVVIVYSVIWVVLRLLSMNAPLWSLFVTMGIVSAVFWLTLYVLEPILRKILEQE